MKGSPTAAIILGIVCACSAMAQDAVPDTLFVPVGTILTVQVKDFLSSDRNTPGDGFRGMLQQPLVVDGWVVARPGQTVLGYVVSAQKAGRGQGTSQLGIELAELLLVDGQQLPIRTQLLQTYGPESRRDDATTIAAGTIIGTVIGAAAGGGKGAAIGAGAGAAATVAGVLATRGRPTEIHPESSLTFRLDAPLTISTTNSAHAFVPVSPSDYRKEPVLYGPSRVPRAHRRATYDPPPFYGPVFAYPYPAIRVVRPPLVVVRRAPVVFVQPRIVFGTYPTRRGRSGRF